MSYSEEMLDALDNQDLEAAGSALKQALAHDPVAVLEELGENLYHLGFTPEALEVFQHLLQRDSENTDYLLFLGELMAEESEFDAAFSYLDQIPQDSPAYPEALLDMADIYQLLELPEVAEQKLLQARTLLPNEEIIDFALAELYFSLNRFQEAAALYGGLVEAGKTELASVSLLERLGISLAMAGEFETAVAPLTQALDHEETEDRLFYLGYTYQQLHEDERAIALYQRLLEYNPEYATVYLHLGRLLQGQERLEEARSVLEQGLRYAPFQSDLFLMAAENAYRLHAEARAEEILNQALTIGEQQEEVVLALSNLYSHQERFSEVQKLYQDYPSDLPEALWDQARAANALEDYDEAFKLYALAYAGLKDEPSFMKEYGLFLREEGRIKEARQLLTHYLAHEPEDLEVQSILESLQE